MKILSSPDSPVKAVPPNGANPMRWDCTRQECYLEQAHPRLEQLASALGGRRNFGNIDGVTERGGHFLVYEEKSGRDALPIGQRRMLEAFTNGHPGGAHFTVVVAYCPGAPTESMEAFRVLRHGVWSPWQAGDLDRLRKGIRQWDRQHGPHDSRP